MKIDFHTHLFPRNMCENRQTFFEHEPSFRLLYENPAAKLIMAESLIPVMKKDGIDLSVIFGFPWKTSEFIKMNNDYIVKCVTEYPDKFKGLSCFDVFAPGIAEETERCLNLGLSGVGELALYRQGISRDAIRKLGPVMDLCRSHDLPVMIHTNEPVGFRYPGKAPMTLSEIEYLVSAFPHNKIILAHLGGGILFFNLLKKEMKTKLKNVYYDIAAVPYLYDSEIYKIAVSLTGDDKILLGSDYPLIRPGRYMKDLSVCGIGEDSLNKITGLNAARLLKVR